MIRVLVVDDDEGVLRVLVFLLGRVFGHEVVAVDRASAILETIRNVRPDVVIQDVEMVGFDIFSHMKTLRSNPETARLPVLLLTGSCPTWEPQEVGADGLMAKPFEVDALGQAIDRLATQYQSSASR